MRRNGLILLLSLILCGCEGTTTFRSSVPAYPVRVVIDTRLGSFVHFQPTAMGSFVVANKEGYYLNNKWAGAASAIDAFGYGGVVVFVGAFGYDAYDMACPYCAEKGKCMTCEISSAFAECPKCGELYDLQSGMAAPQKGISHEAMRKLNIINSDGRLTITQKQ